LSVMTNPPPVVKSHGNGTIWAFAAGMPVKIATEARNPVPTSVNTSLVIVLRSLLMALSPPLGNLPLQLGNGRSGRGQDHLGNTVESDVHSVHHSTAG